MASKTIMVVDDIDETRGLLVELLEDRGYRAHAAKDGREALANMRIAPPDVLVTDLMMPEMDGAELVSLVRADPNLRVIPIIVLTASGLERARELLGEAANELILVEKPMRAADLLEAVAAALPNTRRIPG